MLLLDGQTTGSRPERGQLIELAWARGSASAVRLDHPAAGLEITSRLIALPEGERLPRRISALTGIDAATMRSARAAAEVWTELGQAVGDQATTVIHYARFEEPFLRALHHAHGPSGEAFPLDILCTHTLALALLPELPRRGLRALAGYFGHLLGELKRAGPHVAATAVVWHELVDTLNRDRGVTDLASLRALIEEQRQRPRPRRRGRRTFPMSRERRLSLPDEPGVYRMLARGGAVLYVGKATSLQRRFNSYFQKRRHPKAERTLELLTQVRDVEVTPLSSALEAALRETDEIKRLAPPYNKALRNDGACWFASLDARRSAPAVDDAHPLGPLPGPEALTPLGLMVTLSNDPEAEGSAAAALGLPAEVQIDPEVFSQGLELFRQAHGPTLASGALTLAALLRAGAASWREARDAPAIEDEEDDEDGNEERADDWRERPWDAERVAAALDGVVCRGAHLLRRAHLLCQLTEATVLFRPKNHGAGSRRLLVFEAGRLISAADGSPGQALDPPPGHRRPWRARQALFDGATYDRLRVLTTELKRLVSEGAEVRLSLGPGAELDRDRLARRLAWV